METRRNVRWRAALVVVGGLAAVVVAIGVRHVNGASRRAATASVNEQIPKGRWRLAAPAELDRVVLFVSHVLVRHRQAEASIVPFNPGDWARQGPPDPRSRERAQDLAKTIQAQVRVAPHRFAELAATNSEDAVTGPRGGALGGVTATDLLPWPHVLDALAALRTGEVSTVVETEFGFHVFRRDPPPPLRQVAGRRIAIGYRGTSWLEVVGRPLPYKTSRTREQALRLANEIVGRARSQREDFGSLVARYSEHRDAAQGGDLGLWSNQEPTYLTREIEVLSDLEIGGVSDPVDSRVGIEILQRTPATPRARYAMAAIRLPFDPEAPGGSPPSRASVRASALALIDKIAAQPELFAETRRLGCCIEPEQWTAGRGPFGLDGFVAGLDIGGPVSRTPAISDGSFVIAKRLDPATLPAATPAFDLPNPAGPDIAYLMRTRHGRALAPIVRAIATEFSEQLVRGERAGAFRGIHDTLATTLERESDGDARVASHRAALARLQAVLAPAEFEKYSSFVDRHVERQILAGGSR